MALLEELATQSVLGWAGDRAGGHLGRLQGVCGRLRWTGGGGEEQLVQLGDFHSLDRLGHKLVLKSIFSSSQNT